MIKMVKMIKCNKCRRLKIRLNRLMLELDLSYEYSWNSKYKKDRKRIREIIAAETQLDKCKTCSTIATLTKENNNLKQEIRILRNR